MKLRHLAIIPDGNRRWAREKNLDLEKGYWEGMKKFYEITEWLVKETDIEEISFYILSYDNFRKRSKFEINLILKLLDKELDNILSRKNSFLEILESTETKVNVYGLINLLPENIIKKLNEIVSKTKENKNKRLNLLICYSGRYEILDAIKKIKNFENIDEEKFKEYLWVKNDVDLIIRTGKYSRLSDLLIYQSAYAELIVFDKYWPDITIDDIKKAINTYYNINRNFGR